MRWLPLLALLGCISPIGEDEHAARLDNDGDGHLPASAGGDDCDDGNPEVHTAAIEWCNGRDDNCDGEVDEPGARGERPYWSDMDGDGVGGPNTLIWSCTAAGMLEDDRDCDDADASVHPNADERCNGIDDNCDGLLDEEDPDVIGFAMWHPDADGDGYGDLAGAELYCTPPDGWLEDATDCDDGLASINPGADELCNGIDDDCDGDVDGPNAVDQRDFFQDFDGDGFGDDNTFVQACEPAPGGVTDGGDCDDYNPYAWPGAPEWCGDGFDNDCSGIEDDNAFDAGAWFPDTDGDGYGDGALPTLACSAPVGAFVADGSDCDDADALTYPGADELCTGLDTDCDGLIDDGAIDATEWFSDGDGDTFGEPGLSVWACAAAGTDVSDDTDCDDADATIYPGAGELCDDGIDNNCDGVGCGGLLGDVYAASAPLILMGGEHFGLDVAAGDLTGDGVADLIIGEPHLWATGGQIHTFAGPLGGGLMNPGDAASTIEDTSGDPLHLGADVEVGDVTGDGLPDLVAGSPGWDGLTQTQGAVFIFDGPLAPGVSPASANGTLEGAGSNDQLGTWLHIGDHSNNGQIDILTSAIGTTEGGSVYLFQTPIMGVIQSDLAEGALHAEASGDGAADDVAAPGDISGDGVGDYLITAPMAYAQAGAAYYVQGPFPSGSASLSQAHAILTGPLAGDMLGNVDGADFNGDGYVDVVAAARQAPGGATLWIHDGPFIPSSGTIDVAANASRSLGAGLVAGGPLTVGDVNNDDVPDLVVGGPELDSAVGISGAGAVFVLFGPIAGSGSLNDADVRLYGSEPSQWFGAGMLVVDLDGDSFNDLVLGGPDLGSSPTAPNTTVFFGESL
jgi:hypothetical protein